MPVNKQNRRPLDEEEDLKPRRKRDVEEETPRRKSREDDDEPKPKKRRASEDDDDDLEEGKKPVQKGWGAVAKKRKDFEENKSKIDEFWLSDGESAIIQFLEPEPVTVVGHNVIVNKKWKFLPCQLAKQRYCLMCREGIKETHKIAFKVLDYRGTWNKDKKKFKYDTQVEKLWYTTLTLAEQIKAFIDKRGKELDEVVLEVTRTGSGKNTTYNIELALDDDDVKMKPIKKKAELPTVEECVRPLSDDALENVGFSADE